MPAVQTDRRTVTLAPFVEVTEPAVVIRAVELLDPQGNKVKAGTHPEGTELRVVAEIEAVGPETGAWVILALPESPEPLDQRFLTLRARERAAVTFTTTMPDAAQRLAVHAGIIPIEEIPTQG